MLTLAPFCAEALPLLPEIRSAARRFAGARADVADDLVQETFMRALAAQNRYQPGTNARAWLYAILFNAARTSFRRQKRDRRLEERYAREPQPTQPAPGDTHGATNACGERQPLSEPLLSILASLPPAYRTVVEQVDIEGLRYREVAERMRLPVGTVMSRLHRGRRKLREALDRAEER